MEKIIFLVDMNAFFISCESTRNSGIIKKPAAVAGDPERRTGIILTANYEARKFGVKTAMTVHQALKLCPNMVLVPPDHKFYKQKSMEVMELLNNYTPIIEKNSIDEAWLDMTGTEHLFGTPLETAKKIMQDIKKNLGLWCSIGISENKFLAKIASDMKKPQGITQLFKKDIKHKLWPLPVTKMNGVGKKTAYKLNTLGIETIGDLANYNKLSIASFLGKPGVELYEKANGLGSSYVKVSSPDDVKSIGRSTTLPKDTSDIEELKHFLLELSEDVGITARKHNKKGHTVQITLKFSDFNVITRQMTVPSTCYTKDIYTIGVNLLKKNLTSNKLVRLIGISLSGFEENQPIEQLSLFDINNKTKDNFVKNKKDNKIDEVMDKIRDKHGFNKISRGSLVEK